MALPSIMRKLFRNDGYGPLLKDEIIDRHISIQDWSSTYDYPVNTLVRGSDGVLYWSVAQSGPGIAAGAQDPTADTVHAYWQTVDVANLDSDIRSKLALDGSNASSIGTVLSTYMAHAVMPSTRTESMAVPASGGTVQAPGDGYLTFAANATVTTQTIIELYLPGIIHVRSLCYNTAKLYAFLPVSKGASITVEYTASTTNRTLDFVYANGAY